MMGAPAGVDATRWSQLVSTVMSETGKKAGQADAWLNSVWSNRFQDETGNDSTAHVKLRAVLETAQPDAPTFPIALERQVT